MPGSGCESCHLSGGHMSVNEPHATAASECLEHLDRRFRRDVLHVVIQLATHSDGITADHSHASTTRRKRVCNDACISLNAREGVAAHDVRDLARIGRCGFHSGSEAELSDIALSPRRHRSGDHQPE